MFNALFYGKLEEQTDEIQLKLDLEYVNESVFKEFLKYFYMTKVNLTAENIAGILYLGDKYNVKKCISERINFLKKTLDNENIYSTLHLAIYHSLQKLMKICEKFIILNFSTVL